MEDTEDGYISVAIRPELASLFERVQEQLDMTADELLRQALLIEFGSDLVRYNIKWPMKLWFVVTKEQQAFVQNLAEQYNCGKEQVFKALLHRSIHQKHGGCVLEDE